MNGPPIGNETGNTCAKSVEKPRADNLIAATPDRQAAAGKLATDAAFATWPDVTEPGEFEGHPISRIVIDRSSLRFAFVQGAAWQRGEGWAQPKVAAK